MQKPIKAMLFVVLTMLCNQLHVVGAERTISFPKPTGPNAVGYHDCTIDIESADDHQVNRRIALTLWYPADVAAEEVSCCSLTSMEHYKKSLTTLCYSSQEIKKLNKIKTHFFPRANLKQGMNFMPVILCSPGFGYVRHDYIVACSTLASYGFCVVSIDHNLESLLPREDLKKVKWLNLRQQIKELIVSTYCSDYKAVLSWLKMQDEDAQSPLYSYLNVTNIGILGHLQSIYSAAVFASEEECVSTIVMLNADEQEGDIKDLFKDSRNKFLFSLDVDTFSEKKSDDSGSTDDTSSLLDIYDEDALILPWHYVFQQNVGLSRLRQAAYNLNIGTSLLKEESYFIETLQASKFVAAQIAQFFKRHLL